MDREADAEAMGGATAPASRTRRHERVLVVAHGELDPTLLDAAGPIDLLIAADGAAARLHAAGRLPDLVVGDGDSLDAADRERLARLGVTFRDAPRDKDESDAELGLIAAIEAGARRITLVGALGGARPEHAIANLLLLADPRLDEIDVVLLAGRSRLRRIGTASGPGRIELGGRTGDLVSLLPLAGPVEGVRTDGLRFPLADERLEPGPARGLSNELVGATATISSRRGRLLVVSTPADVPTEGGSP